MAGPQLSCMLSARPDDIMAQTACMHRCRPVTPDETRALSTSGVALLRSPELLHTGIMLCNPSQPGWPVCYVSSTWVTLTGVSADRAMQEGLWAMFCEPGECC